MCGIAGIISNHVTEISKGRLVEMTDVIAHRGPDGSGHWISENGQVGLGHRRLSIIDLSHQADQPMHYLDRYTIVFNGEIYNYIELKEKLLKQNFSFRTDSDTEVLLALFHREKEKCIAFLDGMFSFVIYDSHTNKIFCARDRFGEKPFFYSSKKGGPFIFGSEMKCLWAAGVAKELNNRMLFNYINNSFLSDPNSPKETFYANCKRLPHSHYMWIDVSNMACTIHKYYDVDHTQIDHSINQQDAEEKFYQLMRTSVKRRLRSDVPVGSSLSGGLDSSIIVSLIDQLKNGKDQQTFSAVFPGFIKDERKYIDYFLAKTTAEPNFITPTEDKLLRDIDKLIYHQEEPFGSASIFAQYAVFGLAKEKNVTVLLDGQGADEMLGGYHYFYEHYFNELRKTNPAKYKEEREAYEKMHAHSSINGLQNRGAKYWAKKLLTSQVNRLKLMRTKYNQWTNPILDKEFFNEHIGQSIIIKHEFSSLNHMLYHSTFEYGLQELLRYSDRNSMAHSREVRLPFLSHELVNFIFSLPAHYKINNGWTKYIARKSFEHMLPPEITWRTDKIGYEPPQKKWMQNAQIKEYIRSKMEFLVKEHIFDKKALENGLLDKEGSSSALIKWRFFMAGSLFQD